MQALSMEDILATLEGEGGQPPDRDRLYCLLQGATAQLPPLERSLLLRSARHLLGSDLALPTAQAAGLDSLLAEGQTLIVLEPLPPAA